MADNPYTNKVVYAGQTLIDLTGDTATAADVAQGKVFHLANGAQAIGTAAFLYPALVVTITNGTATSVTATLNSTVVNLTYDSTEDVWRGTLKAFGTWTVEATDGEKTVSDTVDVTNVAVYTASLRFSPLPSGYTELEYLQSPTANPVSFNTQLISIYGFAIVFSIEPQYRGTFISVVRDSTTTTKDFFIYLTDSLVVSENVSGSGDKQFVGSANLITLNAKNDINASAITGAESLSVNGVSVDMGSGWPTSHSFASNAPWYIGSSSAEGTNVAGKWLGPILFYSDSGLSQKAAEFYPARRDSDGAIGLYDIVRALFITPESGTPVAGPEVTQLAA